MRIIVNAYLGKKITGIGRYFIEIVSSIAALNPDLELLIYTNFDNTDLLTFDFKSKNIIIKPYNISKLRPIANLLFNAFVFPTIIIRENADLLYIPNFSPLLFKVRPTVSVVYDTIEFKLKNKFSRIRTLYRQFIVPRMAKLSDHVITISESSKRDIIELFNVDERKITVASCAVSGKFTSEKNTISPFNAKYILYVGTVDHPGKNVLNSIRAFESYKKQVGNDLHFVICGMPGKGYDIVDEAMINSPYAHEIVYKGYVHDDELFLLYSHAELFIFTSLYEGFGLPILEAMRYGIPVITSNKSSLPEVAGDAAIICDPDDIEKIASSIGRVLHDPELRGDMIRKGYENLKRFSWDDAAHKTVHVFETLLKQQNPTSKD